MPAFVTGLHCAFSGLRLLPLPGVRLYVLVPLLLNTLIFAAVILFGAGGLEHMTHWLSTRWTWLEWIAWLLWPIFILIVLVVVFFCFSLLANLIAAPFNGYLSAAVEQQLTGQRPPEAGSLATLPAELAGILMSELRKLGYFAVRALPLLLLFIIPVLQAGAPVIWFFFAAWMMALEYMDYPLGNRGKLFLEIRAVLAQQRALSLGLGTGILLMTLVPVLNFLAMPAGVAAATRLYVEHFRPVKAA